MSVTDNAHVACQLLRALRQVFPQNREKPRFPKLATFFLKLGAFAFPEVGLGLWLALLFCVARLRFFERSLTPLRLPSRYKPEGSSRFLKLGSELDLVYRC